VPIHAPVNTPEFTKPIGATSILTPGAPEQVVKSGSYKTLSRHQIDQGVIALVLAANLSGGSMGDMDLYRLARTYLWSDEARTEINAVVARHGL
jgi:hypothetical protein